MSVLKDTHLALSRRRLLTAAGTGLVAAAGLSVVAARPAAAAPTAAEQITKVAGGTPKEGRVKIDGPEIAENGNTVPVTIEVESPMTADNYVKSVYVFADGNPAPDVASFNFTPQSGKAYAKFRIRLAKTQNVKAVAVMSDGSSYIGSKEIKVTIGGCGG
ncbi:MAG: thiosulfate oxidation carrier protein SoxY [Rhodospirillaceae bacterium]